MSARRKARKRAIDLLYEAEIKGIQASSLLEIRPPEELSEGAYSAHLIKGVESHRLKIDELITAYAEGWDLDRLPAVDRNILRVAIFEILAEPELADNIAIDEAISIAEEISTTESAKYINGVLGRISRVKEVIVF